MPLPKIATPTYSMVLPSTEKEINYRPFLVKEEKLLVLALESEDTKQITTAIKAVLKSCFPVTIGQGRLYSHPMIHPRIYHEYLKTSIQYQKLVMTLLLLLL